MSAWQPYWQASHAYSLTAVVIPTTFGGYTWRCTTGGTTGGSEPSWPADPSVTPTVTDGSVTWSVGTGFMQALQSGVASLVTTFAQANPTIIRSVSTVRPRGLAGKALPGFFLGDVNEQITTANGVRTRLVPGFSAYLMDAIGDSVTSNDKMNFARDALTDLFTANYHAISGRSILQHTATLDTELDEGGVTFPGLEFQFAQTSVAEGRT